ncbi:hypothetical protein Tco_0287194 [Tanacetum coccineum]
MEKLVTLSHPHPPIITVDLHLAKEMMMRMMVLLVLVMAALVISISSDISVESVGSSFLRVILIDSISVEVPVTPKFTTSRIYSTLVSPFLCSDDSKSDTEMPESHVSPTPHDAMFTRWRSIVASRSSSHTTSTPDIPTTPIPPAPPVVDILIGRLYRTHPGGPCRALTARKSVRPLPSYHLALRYTSHHLDCFTLGSSSGHSSSDHSSSRHSISDHSSLDYSSSGHFISGHSLSRHTPPDTTIADSSTPPRFVYPPLARTPQYSKAYRHWRSALLSTMYLPTTSESLVGDSSSELSVGPSRKRCWSLTAIVTSSIHASRALVLSRADLLPPHKRFRDSTLLEDSVEEDIDTDVLADIKVDATAVEVAVDRDVEVGVNASIDIEVDVRVDVEDEVEDEVKSSDRGTIEVRVDVVARIAILDGMLMPDATERLEQVEEVVRDIYGHVIEIPLQRVEDIKTGHRELEARSLIAGGERACLLDQGESLERSNARLRGTVMMESARADRFRRHMSFIKRELRQICRFRYYDRMRFRRLETFAIMTITRSGMTPEAIEELINQRVSEALVAYEANRVAELAVESQSHNRDDDDNGNVGGNGNGNGGGNGDGNGGGNGNGNGGGNGNGNPNRNNRGVMPVPREYIYHDFVKC